MNFKTNPYVAAGTTAALVISTVQPAFANGDSRSSRTRQTPSLTQEVRNDARQLQAQVDSLYTIYAKNSLKLRKEVAGLFFPKL